MVRASPAFGRELRAEADGAAPYLTARLIAAGKFGALASRGRFCMALQLRPNFDQILPVLAHIVQYLSDFSPQGGNKARIAAGKRV